MIKKMYKNKKAVFIHLFFILGEIALLFVQYQRAEVFAFDVFPDLADVSIYGLYGSQIMGGLWVFIVILFTYLFWELFLKFLNKRIKIFFVIIIGFLNIAVIIGEFVFFYLLIENDVTGFLGYLVGFLLVAAHQVLSFWIMKNVVREFFYHNDIQGEHRD